jgi:hypothetical protein
MRIRDWLLSTSGITPALFNLGRNITDDKTDYGRNKRTIFHKSAACIAIQRYKTVNWDSVQTLYQYLTDRDNEIIHEYRSIEKHVGHGLNICLTNSNFVGFSYFYDSPAIRV